jgi:pyrroloquinoline quinone biosynthesis protein B
MPMHRIALAASILLALAPSEQARSNVERVEAIILGIAQDGGVPHLGCRQKLCVDARRDPSKRRHVACLGLVDGKTGKRFLIDATPDFESQVAGLGGMPDGILLTHAHIGHYLGLAQLGREVANACAMPVFCTPSMAAFLRANRPWSRLVESKNIEIREIRPGVAFELTDSLHVTALKVPHRDEDSDTVAFLVAGPSRRLLWLPDIDKWEKWDRRIEDVVRTVDVAFLDGTFFSADEIPGRSIADIPHPLVPETVSRLSGRAGAASIFFVHLNHTNRLLWDETEVRRLKENGFGVAFEGQRLSL